MREPPSYSRRDVEQKSVSRASKLPIFLCDTFVISRRGNRY